MWKIITLALAFPCALYIAPDCIGFFYQDALVARAKSLSLNQQVIFKGLHFHIGLPKYSFQNGLSYRFALHPENAYNHQDEHQTAWNKLPGFSDCGSQILSRYGAMYGWRYVPSREVFELSAYANAGVGQRFHYETSPQDAPLLTLTKQEVANFAVFDVEIKLSDDTSSYIFTLEGEGKRVVSKLPRGCRGEENAFKHISNFYFGGQKLAPHTMQAFIRF